MEPDRLPPGQNAPAVQSVVVEINPEPDLDDKILCRFWACGRQRNCTATKMKFFCNCVVYAILLVVDLVAIVTEPETRKSRQGYLALVNLVVLVIARPPHWGRVGDDILPS